MKLNWGHGIAIFYISFMVIMIYYVVKSTTHDNSLVMDNYYEQDLKYQSHYDKVVNTQGLKQPVAFLQNNSAHTIEIQFPEEIQGISGSVQFFRPSTKHKDITLPINVDETGKMVIPTKQLQSGYWKIKMEWQGNQTAFYTEKDIEL